MLQPLQVFQQEEFDSLVQRGQEVKIDSEVKVRGNTQLSLESLFIASHTSPCDLKLFKYSLEVNEVTCAYSVVNL